MGSSIESNYPLSTAENHQEWEPIITDKGYKHDGLNRYYIRVKLGLNKLIHTPSLRIWRQSLKQPTTHSRINKKTKKRFRNNSPTGRELRQESDDQKATLQRRTINCRTLLQGIRRSESNASEELSTARTLLKESDDQKATLQEELSARTSSRNPTIESNASRRTNCQNLLENPTIRKQRFKRNYQLPEHSSRNPTIRKQRWRTINCQSTPQGIRRQKATLEESYRYLKLELSKRQTNSLKSTTCSQSATRKSNAYEPYYGAPARKHIYRALQVLLKPHYCQKITSEHAY